MFGSKKKKMQITRLKQMAGFIRHEANDPVLDEKIRASLLKNWAATVEDIANMLEKNL